MTTTTKIEFKAGSDIQKLGCVYDSLRRVRPKTRQDLKNYVKVFLGVDVPDRQICPEHNSPMDYLWYSFAADFSAWAEAHPTLTRNTRDAPRTTINADCIVWANRTGGKTELAAVATLLDCIFKSGCQVRILAGSGEQAGRMYEYLTHFIHNGYDEYIDGPVFKTKCRFTNGSAVEVLTQSPTSVRGQHVQKLRCDEVELFDEDVFGLKLVIDDADHIF